MPDRNSSFGEQALADRLRREAMEERPRFSLSLHERLCAAIVASKVRAGSVPVGPAAGRRPRRALAAGACVVVLLGVGIGFWLARWHGGPLPRGASSQPGGVAALPHSSAWRGLGSQGALTGLEDASSGMEWMSLLTGQVAEDAGLLMERAVIERLVEHGRRTYHALDNRVPLNAACALIFGSAASDSP